MWIRTLFFSVIVAVIPIFFLLMYFNYAHGRLVAGRRRLDMLERKLRDLQATTERAAATEEELRTTKASYRAQIQEYNALRAEFPMRWIAQIRGFPPAMDLVGEPKSSQS